jgi:monoamine oxidase
MSELASAGLHAPVHDTIVIGAGISGLVGAWHLRDRDVVLLEAEDRVGGRIRSERRGDHWLNLGAHLVSGGQVVHGLAAEFRVPLVIPPGLTGTTVAWGSKLVRARRPEYLPFLLPLSMGARMDLCRVGLRLKSSHRRAIRADACGLLGPHVDPPEMGVDASLGERSFADLIRESRSSVFELLRLAANRAAAEPPEISAHYVSMSSISAGEAPRYNVVGGTEQLLLAIRGALGGRVRTGCRVERVVPGDDRVRIEFVGPDGPATIEARTCLVSVPAPTARTIVQGLPPAKDAALASIPYGAYVVAGFFTKERRALPWADRYMVVAPGRAFGLLFNAANASRPAGVVTGGGFIVYAGGQRAQTLLSWPDAAITELFLDDLSGLAPELRGAVDEAIVQRWPLGNPITGIGRAELQPEIAAPFGRVHFAADYIGHPGMDSAASVAIHAAREIRRQLDVHGVRHVA